MEELLSKFSAYIIGGVAALIWLVRLESVALTNRKEIARLWEQRKEDMQAAKDARDESNRMLSEIRADVKQLIREMGK